MTDTAADTADTTTDTPDTDDTGTDTAAELAKWKAAARKHEDRAKANQAAVKELEQLRQQTMTDSEKAIAEARADARIETLREVGGELVDSAVRVAVAGRTDVDALLEGLDRSRFLGEDGRPDHVAIGKWVERILPAQKEDDQQSSSGWPDLGQGVRSTQSTSLGDPLLASLKKTLGI